MCCLSPQRMQFSDRCNQKIISGKRGSQFCRIDQQQSSVSLFHVDSILPAFEKASAILGPREKVSRLHAFLHALVGLSAIENYLLTSFPLRLNLTVRMSSDDAPIIEDVDETLPISNAIESGDDDDDVSCLFTGSRVPHSHLFPLIFMCPID